MSPLTLSAAQLTALILAEFPGARVSCRDERYAVPELRPLLADLRLQLPGALRTLGEPPVWRTAFDCDKFSLFAHAIVAIKHSLAQGVRTDAPEGAAFGELLYRRDDGVGHAINLVLAVDDGETEPRLFAIEPQTQEVVDLSDTEKRSAWEVVL